MVVRNGGIDNYIIVSHSVPMSTTLNVILTCRFSLISSSETLFDLCSDIMRVGPQPRVWAPWGIFIQASPLVDLPIVVCDTYW